ncbi:uncharacterized protein [Henckelia pumila]|uniref:uncharacterized protein n=1 Tax=Henckelia pumila TaxID=405737 RepID=UPI003C6E4EA9
MVKMAFSGTLENPESEKSSKVSGLNPTVTFESTSLQITNHKLNGKNFFQWSRSVQLVIRGKGKFGYLDGSISPPSATDPTYQNWDVPNSMVMAWLINSMEESIGETYLFHLSAKDIWDAVTLAYSDLEDSSQVFEQRNQIRNMRQGDGTVTQYFSALKKLWHEMDLFTVCKWNDPDDGVLYRKMLAKNRVYDFLAGLDRSLDEVRGRILGIKTLPSIDEVFAEVRREESRKRVMLHTLPSTENTALVTRTPESRSDSHMKNGKPWCERCERPYHTIETCWKIHGKPANWVPNKFKNLEKRGFQASANSEVDENKSDAVFSTAQMEQLCKLLSGTAGFSNLTDKGTKFTVLSDLTTKGTPWIIDSGASDHMSSSKKFFSSYTHCKIHQKVKIADGSYTHVQGVGTLSLSNSIVLKDVLHDQISGKRIGSANAVSGLYYLQDEPIPSCPTPGQSTAGGELVQPFPLHFSQKKHPDKVVEPKTPGSQVSNSESGSKNTIDELQNISSPNLDIPIALRKGTRSCTQHPVAKYVAYGHLSASIQALISNLSSVKVTSTIQEAWNDFRWKQAVLEEMQELEMNETWEIVQKPKEKIPFGYRWVFTIKYRADGSVERYKARLVAKGYTQTYGVDYQETFAPVAKINTVRVLLSLATNLDWPLYQLDVKNAFLNGDLEEEVYMELPPGFDEKSKNGKVCRLKKSLYGLKQSPQAWFDKFTKAILKLDFLQAHTDHTLFYRHRDGKITILIVYVDDIVLTGDDLEEM